MELRFLVQFLDTILQFIRQKEPSGTSKKIAEFCFALGADKLRFLPDPNEISCDDVIIDGLLGSGLNRPPTDHYLDVIEWINVSRKNGAKVIAIDIPSGLNASTGSTPGTAVKADFTMMCLSRKQGCFTNWDLICAEIYPTQI